jgi:hypothetical protein
MQGITAGRHGAWRCRFSAETARNLVGRVADQGNNETAIQPIGVKITSETAPTEA